MAKSNPIGVRFDLDKLELIKKQQKLSSPQSVLNYLMDNYNDNTSNSNYGAYLAHKPDKASISIKKEEIISPELAIQKTERGSYNPFNNPRFKNKL